MFRDYNKYLSASLKVYLFVLFCIFILKLVGLDYFGLDKDNILVININMLCSKYYLVDLWYFTTLLFYVYVVISISSYEKKCGKYVLCFAPLIFLIQHSKQLINSTLISSIIDFIYLYLMVLIYYKIKHKKDYKTMTIRFITYNIASIVIQIISYIVRYKYDINYDFGFIENFIFNFDYLIMTVIVYKIVFMKGGLICYQTEVCSFLQKKTNLKNLLKKLQKSYHNFKQQDKKTKLTYIIYFIFSLIWNILSVIVILFVANLNHAIIECIFILTSFWLSKHIFGKVFHLPNMIQCFIVSNLTYYILNRVTTPLGISILVPIMLGVGLSYVTSKFVKKLYKPLYRGMPQDEFKETILKVTRENSYKYKICYEYFVLKKSAIYLSLKYNYSEAGIRKIKDRINQQIKELK